MLRFALFITSVVTGFFLYSLLFFFIGFLLIRRFPRLGSRLWAMSGLFMKKLPMSCPADRCRSCSLYNCPNFRKDKTL